VRLKMILAFIGALLVGLVLLKHAVSGFGCSPFLNKRLRGRGSPP
jgi:hypothetical protein